MELLQEALHASGYDKTIEIAIDSACSSLYVEGTGKYDLNFKNPEKSKSVPHITKEELNKIFESYVAKYPIVMIEDPFD